MMPRRHPFPKIIERVRGLSIFCLKSDRIAGIVRQKRIEVRVPKHADPRALQDVSLTDRPTSMGRHSSRRWHSWKICIAK